jgi:hypothetical protein
MSYGAIIYNDSSQILLDSDIPAMVKYQSGTLNNWYTYEPNQATAPNPRSDGYYYFDCGSPFNFVANGDYYYVSNQQSPYTKTTNLNPNPVLWADASPYGPNEPNWSTLYGKTPEGATLKANNAMLFVELKVGEKMRCEGALIGKRPNTFCGVAHTNSAPKYALVRPRTNTANPTGYGMAFYDAAGKCTWDAETALGHISAATYFSALDASFTHPDGALYVLATPMPFWIPVTTPTKGSHQMALHRTSTTVVKAISVFTANSGETRNVAPGLPIVVGKF